MAWWTRPLTLAMNSAHAPARSSIELYSARRLVFFGNKSKAEEFAEEINAFFQDLDKPLDSSDEGMTGEELETRLSDLIRMAKVAPQINSKAHLLARLSEIQVGLERLLRDFNA